MKAVLEIDMPESCEKCRMRCIDEWSEAQGRGFFWFCHAMKEHIPENNKSRHSGCPLKIVEVNE